MAGRYEVEITIGSARDLKNVNWRNGDLCPYVVLWIDPAAKSSTRVATAGDDEDPVWDEKLTVPLPPGIPLEDAVIYLDVVHAGRAEGVKPLVGSTRLRLREVVDEVGIGSKLTKKLKLKRPSGRPQGKIEVTVAVKEPGRYYDHYAAPPFGKGVSEYGYAPPPTGYPYSGPTQNAPTPTGYAYSSPTQNAPTPTGYAYSGPVQNAPTPTGYAYSSPAQNAPTPTGYPYSGPVQNAPTPPGYNYGYGAPPVGAQYAAPAGYGQEGKSKSKMGMGTGLAVGAAAGLLGGLAIAEGVDYVEDKIADDVTERVEDNLDDGGYDGDDF